MGEEDQPDAGAAKEVRAVSIMEPTTIGSEPQEDQTEDASAGAGEDASAASDSQPKEGGVPESSLVGSDAGSASTTGRARGARHLQKLRLESPDSTARRVSEAPMSPIMAGVDRVLRARLVRFYERYNPSMLGIVDDTATVYSGKEEELFQMLVRKYGPEPTDDAGETEPEGRARNRSIAQSKLRRRAQTLRHKGASGAQGLGPLGRACRGLVPPVPPSPPDLTAPQLRNRRRLVRYYLTYCSSRLEQVDVELAEREWDAEAILKDLTEEFPPSDFPEPEAEQAAVTVSQETREAYRACCQTTTQTSRLLRRLGTPQVGPAAAAAATSPRLSVTPPPAMSPKSTPGSRPPRSPRSALMPRLGTGLGTEGPVRTPTSTRLQTPLTLSPPFLPSATPTGTGTADGSAPRTPPESHSPHSNSAFDKDHRASLEVDDAAGTTQRGSSANGSPLDDALGTTVCSMASTQVLRLDPADQSGVSDVVIAGHTVAARVVAELTEEELQYASFRRRRRYRRQDKCALPPAMRCKGCAQFDAVCSRCFMKVRKAGSQRREWFKNHYASYRLKDRIGVFFSAVAAGEEDDVKVLLKHCGADPNWTVFFCPAPDDDVAIPSSGVTLSPLHCACAYHRPDLVMLLLSHGARYRRDRDGVYPLQYVTDVDADHDICMYLLELTNEFDDALATQEAWDHYHSGNLVIAAAAFCEVDEQGGPERDTVVVGRIYCMLQQCDWAGTVQACDAALNASEPIKWVECEPGHVLEARKHAQQSWCAEEHPRNEEVALKGCGCVLLGQRCTVPLQHFRRGPLAVFRRVLTFLPCDVLFDVWAAVHTIPLLRECIAATVPDTARSDPQSANALMRKQGAWQGLYEAVATAASTLWNPQRDGGELVNCSVAIMDPRAIPALFSFEVRAGVEMTYQPARSALKNLFRRASATADSDQKPELKREIVWCTATQFPPPPEGCPPSSRAAYTPLPVVPPVDLEAQVRRVPYDLTIRKKPDGRLGIPMHVTDRGLRVLCEAESGLAPVASFGVSCGQWIMTVNNQPVSTFDAYSAALQSSPTDVPVSVEQPELDATFAIPGPLSAPGNGSVVSPKGAIVREEADLHSPEVGTLPCGTTVKVEEVKGRRARIISPVSGWLSLFSGAAVLISSADPGEPASASEAAFVGTVWRSQQCLRIRVHEQDVEMTSLGSRLPLERSDDGGLGFGGATATSWTCEKIEWSDGGEWRRQHDEFSLTDAGDGTGVRLSAFMGEGGGIWASGTGISHVAVKGGSYDVSARTIVLTLDNSLPTRLLRCLKLPADPGSAATIVSRCWRLLAFGGVKFTAPPPGLKALGAALSWEVKDVQYEPSSSPPRAK
eukprot:TRINITY_DN46839_c0_g1_i1.p1 TRINITY_DN46839_c0_g1~~TRINITY_DN46839_c0_g1_i1.p1  ORF type:complete len:1367 (+),score=316.34 TRINITY_DN46839_c0_g1_i1:58-4101(+)